MGACASCAAEMPDGVKFCRECGASLAVRSCPACGAPDEGGRFCGDCGAALDGGEPAAVAAPGRPVAERRVTSVLFGDLVGFTPLSESRDAEEVRELLSRTSTSAARSIGRYGGVVEKFIGDAVMAVWGVPVAHEDDAERAVRAGLDLVAAVAAMGAGGRCPGPGDARRRRDRRGRGDRRRHGRGDGCRGRRSTPRLACSRRPSPAGSGSTRRRAALGPAAITFDDAGEHALKGKAEPMRLWQAGARGRRRRRWRSGSTAWRRRSPGGTADLRLVKELFHATEESRPAAAGRPRRRGGDRQVAAGLGVREVRRRARARPSRGTAAAACPTATAWRSGRSPRRCARGSGSSRRDTGDVVAEQLDAGLARSSPTADEREWLRPRLAVLLGAGDRRRCSRGRTCSRPGRRSSSTSPRTANAVVLVIDDAQHADDGLLDFLDHLLGTARAPIFVLALARPELPDAPPRCSAAGGPASCASTRSTTPRWPSSSTGWSRVCRQTRGRRSWPRRGHPALRRRDGARAHRPRPGRATGGPVRRRGRRRARPRRRRRAGVAAGSRRGPISTR